MIETSLHSVRQIPLHCIQALRDGFTLLLIVATASLVLAEPAYAYVDPSVMTYTIQALAGVAVALGAIAGVAFRRTRKAIFKFLRVDENANKTTEANVERIGVHDAQSHDKADAHARELAAKNTGNRPMQLSWNRRIIYSLVASAFFTFTLFVASPYELIGGGSSSLSFGLAETWKPFAFAGIAICILLSLPISLFRGKSFNIAVTAFIGLGLLFYIQALFGNTQLPSADGAAINWDDYGSVMLVNGFAWLIGIAAIAIFLWRKPVICRNSLCVLAVCLTIVEAVGVGSLFTNPVIMGKSANEAQPYVTEEGMFDVSDKSNVVLFLLDWYDNATLDYLYNNNPDLLGEMTGFTYYRDVSGTIAPTRYAVPWILTAQFIQHDESYSHYLSTIYDRSYFLDDLKATGYSLGIYTDTYGATDEEASNGLKYTSQRAFNVHPINTVSLNETGAVLVMYKASLYRNLPWVLKPYFWFYTDQVNQAMAQRDRPDGSPGETIYVMDDANYFEKLQQIHLGINNDEVGSFRLIHLMGIHHPYTLDENGQRVPNDGNSTEWQQGTGVMRIVSEYLRQLKELGVYDKTTVIISCDHGSWIWEEEPLRTPNSPIMLVKPAISDGQSDPIRMSYAPISQFDLHASIMKAITGDGSKYGTAFDEVPEGADRPRMYVHPTVEVPYDSQFIEYEIDGYALDFGNWHTTGQVWDCIP